MLQSYAKNKNIHQLTEPEAKIIAIETSKTSSNVQHSNMVKMDERKHSTMFLHRNEEKN
uniref:Uncharacterized protein n=1 Tax=Arundo donax TaxID=35708 RepID=A0A0A8Z976_ARUDO